MDVALVMLHAACYTNRLFYSILSSGSSLLVFTKMELEALPVEIETKVMTCINEVGNRLEEDNVLIKEWIKCQPHLPSLTFDPRIINLFLRGCKHDLERTKRKIDMYFSSRTFYPDLFSDRDPFSKSIQHALKTFNVVPLPKVTIDGYRITMHRYATDNAWDFDPRAVFKSMFMIADVRLIEEPPIIGDIFLFDVQNMTAGHFAKVVSPVLKSTLHCVQEAYPQRLKEIHLFNAPPLIDRVVSFFKQFLKEKMRNRFYIHSSVDTLYNFIPKSHLPKDYGGDLKELSEMQSQWTKKLKSYKNYFDEQETVKSNETMRCKNSKMSGETFGCEGAFRKLEID